MVLFYIYSLQSLSESDCLDTLQHVNKLKLTKKKKAMFC